MLLWDRFNQIRAYIEKGRQEVKSEIDKKEQQINAEVEKLRNTNITFDAAIDELRKRYNRSKD